jgi:hypothetical protein
LQGRNAGKILAQNKQILKELWLSLVAKIVPEAGFDTDENHALVFASLKECTWNDFWEVGVKRGCFVS